VQTRPTEHEEQSLFFDLIKIHQHEDPRLLNVMAVPNAGKRSIGAMNYYKSEGLSKGFLDVVFFWPSGKYHGMIIEFKRKGKKPRPEQAEWLNRLVKAGYFCVIAYTGVAGFDALQDYLIGNGDER
jgi:hypothetical protein